MNKDLSEGCKLSISLLSHNKCQTRVITNVNINNLLIFFMISLSFLSPLYNKCALKTRV